MSGRWTEHFFFLNLWSKKIKIRILDFFLIRKFSVLQFSILVLIKCTGKKTKTILWWFFCHLIADRVPVVMWRGVTGLERFSFAVEKGIKSRGTSILLIQTELDFILILTHLVTGKRRVDCLIRTSQATIKIDSKVKKDCRFCVL